MLLSPIRFRMKVFEQVEEHHRLKNAIPGVDDWEVAVDKEQWQSVQADANTTAPFVTQSSIPSTRDASTGYYRKLICLSFLRKMYRKSRLTLTRRNRSPSKSTEEWLWERSSGWQIGLLVHSMWQQQPLKRI